MKTAAILMLGLLLALPFAESAEPPGDADDGRKFMPVNLAKEFAVDGLRVQVTARARNDVAGIQMYGTLIEIVAISRLPPP